MVAHCELQDPSLPHQNILGETLCCPPPPTILYDAIECPRRGDQQLHARYNSLPRPHARSTRPRHPGRGYDIHQGDQASPLCHRGVRLPGHIDSTLSGLVKYLGCNRTGMNPTNPGLGSASIAARFCSVHRCCCHHARRGRDTRRHLAHSQQTAVPWAIP